LNGGTGNGQGVGIEGFLTGLLVFSVVSLTHTVFSLFPPFPFVHVHAHTPVLLRGT
jgi:hypothetical protein